MGTLLATSPLWLCGCATESSRHHGVAMKAMAQAGKSDQAQMEIAARPRDTTEGSHTQLQHRWSVSYPSGWKLDDKDGFVKISKGQAILGIHTFVDVAGKSLDEVADAAIQRWEQQIQKVNIVRRISRQRMTLAGDLTAIAIVHHIGTGEVGQSRKVIVVVNNRSFLIDAEARLASWPGYERGFNQIINSFRVLQ